MFPGDPSAHPANVYNCRCSMAAVVKGFRKINSAENKNPSSNSLISELESGIIQSKSMQRKSVNTGAFAQYPEKMSKKHIRDVAKECGIDIKGLTIKVEQNEALIPLDITGIADPEQIGTIIFMPNAFTYEQRRINPHYLSRKNSR